jgi:hypothetical protein
MPIGRMHVKVNGHQVKIDIKLRCGQIHAPAPMRQKLTQNLEFRNHEKTQDLSPHVLSKFEYSELLKFCWLLAGILRCPKQFISAHEITYLVHSSHQKKHLSLSYKGLIRRTGLLTSIPKFLESL